ncbi:MAG: hypothetical protein LiPW15_39 [Parcubacteria group bacterium LiPW_15]|nr:MAG: hypothetical protein LiPW15_39 [Parcubacteria group bacterium LiPW_15]
MEYNRPVSKSFRKALLYALLGVFLVLGTGTILYAQGYRFDFATMRVKKVGAIYIQSHPKDADIFLDGEKREESRGILSSGVLVQSLFPKTYKVELELEGYENWRRTVSVEPSLVTELNPILLPEKRDIFSEKDAQNIYTFQDGSVVLKIGGKIYAGETLIPGTNVVDQSADNNELLTSDSKGNFYLIKLSAGIKPSAQKLASAKSYILDTGSNQLISYSTAQVSLLEAGKVPTKIFTSTKSQIVEAVSPASGLIAWAVYDAKYATSTIFTYERLLGRVSQIDVSLPGKTYKMQLSSRNILGLLQDNAELYFYDLLSGTLEKKSENVRQFSFSPSGAWTAILGEKTLEIYSKDGDYVRLNLSAYPYINSVSWYRDERHLLLNLGSGVGLLDFSAVDPENIQHLANSTNAAYDTEGNILYYVLDGKVWSLTIPK